MDIKIFDQTLWVHGIQGTVQGLRQWTETSVQTTNGSATRDAFGNYTINAPTVQHKVSHHQTFWVVAPSGREYQVNGNYPLRDGQLVSVVYTGLKGRDALGHVFFHNLTTNLRWTEPKGLPSEITHYGQGALTRRYLKVIGFLILIAFGGNLLRNARIVDFSRDFLTTIAIFAFLLIPIGFFHLLFLIEKNKRGALKQLNAAIEADPTFVESLVA